MFIEVVLISISTCIVWFIFRQPHNTPPGYWGLPLFGYIPLFNADKLKILTDLRKKFGDVVSWRFGTTHMVFVFDFKLIKEVLSRNEFADKPQIKSLNLVEANEKCLGITFANGKHWHNLRRFSFRHLQELGMGKSGFVPVVQYEANQLVAELKRHAGKPTILPNSMNISILNIIWQMVASKRYDLDDEEILEFNELINSVLKNLQSLAILEFFPWTTKIIPEFILRKLFKTESHKLLSSRMKEFFSRVIDEHIKNFDKDNPKDYIDAYLIEMDNQKNDPSSTMSIEDLLQAIQDLFKDGSVAITATLHWSIFYLATHPEVQKKLQKEIDEVLPEATILTMEYKARMPYTEAFIHEVLRHSTLLPFGVMHTCSSNAEIAGYRIPKNAMIFTTFFTCHFDAKIFGSPQEFRPERFLAEDGKFLNPRNGFLPFGSGQRQCIGEGLARMELFIFIATFVQNLSFASPTGKTIDLEPDVAKSFYLNLANTNQKVLVNIRKPEA